jgi:hypothetical protein
MMWLKREDLQKISEEWACRETKASFEMGEEHNVFPISRFGFYLLTRETRCDLWRNPVGAVQPVKIVLAGLGSVPAATLALFRNLGIL